MVGAGSAEGDAEHADTSRRAAGASRIGTNYGANEEHDPDNGDSPDHETDSRAELLRHAVAVTAKHYGEPLGYEAAIHTRRFGRVWHTQTGGAFLHLPAEHHNDTLPIDQWLEYALTATGAMGQTSVAVFYPETVNQLEDSAFRYLYAWGFNPRAAAVRRVTEVDYVDERLIDEGFLDRYRVLVFVWGTVMPDATLAKIDAWVKAGGTVIYPAFPRGNLTGLSAGSSRGGRGEGPGRFLPFCRTWSGTP